MNSGGGYKNWAGGSQNFTGNFVSMSSIAPPLATCRVDFIEKLLRSFVSSQMARGVIVFSIEALHWGFRERREVGKKIEGAGSLRSKRPKKFREPRVKKTREQGAKESILQSREQRRLQKIIL